MEAFDRVVRAVAESAKRERALEDRVRILEERIAAVDKLPIGEPLEPTPIVVDFDKIFSTEQRTQ